MKYTIYDPVTGCITHVLETYDPVQASINLLDRHYIDGSYDSDTYYIQQGMAIPKPARPSEEFMHYQFDYDTKQWIQDLAQSQNNVRIQRDKMLVNLDRVNPVWYASLTAEQQADLVAYRQQLLDVPQQPGFPSTIVWPTKPHWL